MITAATSVYELKRKGKFKKTQQIESVGSFHILTGGGDPHQCSRQNIFWCSLKKKHFAKRLVTKKAPHP